MMIESVKIEIEKIAKSRIEEVNFDNLEFGKTFSDHMLICEFKNGQWQEMKILPYDSFKLSPANSAIHYGQSIFEGLKAHRGKDGEVRVFRPDMNAKRLNESAERMCMPAIPENMFLEGLRTLINLDEAWVPGSEGSSLYIRPFMFATDEFLGVRPSENYLFAIITGPVLGYYTKPVDVKIEDEFTRAAKGGTGAAKTAGNYAASLYPAQLAREEGFDQILWTDGLSHEYIEECGTMNVMFRIGDELITPIGDTILDSITRKTVVKVCEDLGYRVTERKIKVTELLDSIENNKLIEAFGVGTAATIAPINLFGYQDKKYSLENSDRSWSNSILETINAIKYGENKSYPDWLMTV